ncbi:MAG: DUF3343 domain-containing protein [Oscillospiraceae bacterium]|nr:DUF3343 domain-containing protein [Oscillospiraceae bacterium]
MLSSNYYVLTFDSTHDAISSEKLLKELLPIKVVPTPRVISASCGIAIRVEEELFEKLKALLDEGRLSGNDYKLYHIYRTEERVLTAEQL